MLTTETRVRATDPPSWRLFGLYWLFIRGGSGLIRHVCLRAILRRALFSVIWRSARGPVDGERAMPHEQRPG
jgi:hypothetical protein